MILLVFMSSVLILFATLFQYNNQSEDYNLRRLLRKENQVKSHLNFIFENSNETSTIFNEGVLKSLNSIADIHKVNFSIYDLEGKPIFFSYVNYDEYDKLIYLKKNIIEEISNSENFRIIMQNPEERGLFLSTFSYIYDNSNKPFAILYFPYFEDISFSQMELNSFLNTLYKIYLFLFALAILVAFFMSRYISLPLEKIKQKIDQTGLLKTNKKISLKNASKEIFGLVNSYNNLVDVLDKSKEKLAKSEREQAWQEMAKQVAHEIKNPLTPMRLSIQSFQEDFDSNESNNKKKVNEFSKILIDQIDVMSKVANSFSDFATMPKTKRENIDIIMITSTAVDIFEKNIISFNHPEKKIICFIDRTQWIRVITNLIQNAIQSVPKNKKPEIIVDVKDFVNHVKVIISDNGSGIKIGDKNKIFEPKFTTKSGGMGLGLGIVKNILNSFNADITFESNKRLGTNFIIKLKK